ncbi:MAG: S8/S53 family peptidase [Deferrisomatales bacterium]
MNAPSATQSTLRIPGASPRCPGAALLLLLAAAILAIGVGLEPPAHGQAAPAPEPGGGPTVGDDLPPPNHGDRYEQTVAPDLAPRVTAVPGREGSSRTVAAYRDGALVATDFVVGEVIVRAEAPSQAEEFARRWGGAIVGDDRVPPPPPGMDVAYDPKHPEFAARRWLVRVDTSRALAEWVAADGSITGMRGRFDFSSAEGARTIALITRERLAGWAVAPNFVSQPHGLLHGTTEGGGVDAFDWNEFSGEGVANGSTVTRAWQLMTSYGVAGQTDVGIADNGFWLDGNGNAMESDVGTDFADHPWQWDFINGNDNASGANEVKCGDTPCPWHGTGAASVATGLLDNGGGAAGTGGLVARPVLMKVGYTSLDTLAAIRTARQWGLDILSMSYGGICNADCDFYTTAVQVEVALAHATGVVLVAAAGNHGVPLELFLVYPCELDHVICVGALRHDGTAASYSNWGSSVDIWAPTNIIAGPDGTIPDALTTFGGTSASAPFVAGVAAMMKHVNGALLGDQVRAILRDTGHQGSTDIRVDRYLDAHAALLRAMDYELPPDALEPNGVAGAYTIVPGERYEDLNFHLALEGDRYRFVVEEYVDMVLQVDHMRLGLGDVAYSLVRADGDPDGAPLSEGWSTSDTSSTFTAHLLVPGPYEVRLSSPTLQAYDMELTLTPTELPEDLFEPNNAPDEAAHPGLGTFDVTLHADWDEDWYEFTVAGLSPLPGSFYRFAVEDSDQPVHIELHEVLGGPGGGSQLVEEVTGVGAGWEFGHQDVGRTFWVHVAGPITRYEIRHEVGYDSSWIEKLVAANEIEFLDPLGPVTGVLVGPQVWVAAHAGVLQREGAMLVGKGLDLEVLDSNLGVVARGVHADRNGRSAVQRTRVDPALPLAADELVLLQVTRSAGATGAKKAPYTLKIAAGP